jgi:Ca2+-binding EF-hand superfamily protein
MRSAGRAFSTEDIQSMIKEVDLENDGQISFEEFKTLMTPEASPAKFFEP